VSRGGGDTWHLEKSRLKAQLDEKNSDMEKTKHEHEVLADQLNYTRKEVKCSLITCNFCHTSNTSLFVLQCDELRRKLEDFDKVSKVQRNMTADTNALTKEVKELRSK
jgi:hypothetical protein